MDMMNLVDEVESNRACGMNDYEIIYHLRQTLGCSQQNVEDAIMVADAHDLKVLEN